MTVALESEGLIWDDGGISALKGGDGLFLVCTHREKMSPCSSIWHPDTHTFTHSLTHSQSEGTHDRRAAYSTHIKTWKAIDRSAKTLSEKRFERVKHFKSHNDKILQYITLLITIELFLLEIHLLVKIWKKYYIYIYIYILVLCSN